MPSPPQLSDSSHRLLWKLAVCCTEDAGGGGGTGVTSFNGQTGDVVLSFADVVAALGCEPECVSNKSNDGTLAANSATLYPTQQAVKTYADTKLALTGGVLSGDLDIGTGIHLDTDGSASFATGAATIATDGTTSLGAGQHVFNPDGSAILNAGGISFNFQADGALNMAGGGFFVGPTGDVAIGGGQVQISALDGSASFATGDFTIIGPGGSFNSAGSGSVGTSFDVGTDLVVAAGASSFLADGSASFAGGLVTLDVGGNLAFLAGGQSIDLGSGFIINLVDPTNPQDAATKAYVDALVGGPFQPLDADLTAIAALATTGFSARTAANTWALRTVVGTANQVIVVDGAGVLGNPTLSLPQDIHISATPRFQRLGLGAAASATHQLLLSGGTITTDDHQIDGAVTWNAGGVTFTGWKLNVTNTASAAASKLIDLQVGGAARFNVTVAGLGVFQAGVTLTTGNATLTTGNIILTAGNIDLSGSAPTVYQTGSANSLRVGISGGGASSPQFQFFGSTHASLAGQMYFDAGLGDVFFRFPGPGHAFGMTLRTTGRVELTGTAVAFDVYNIRTSATSFERLTANWASNVARFWTEKGSGGGSARALVLGADATELMRFGSSTTLSFFAATAVVKQTSGANLTNNVTAGGTDDTIANYTDLVVYANDAAAIRNDIYQLARKLKQINDGLRSYGLFT